MNEETLYCQNCVMPISSVALSLNENSICSACEYHLVYQSISNDEWNLRKKNFQKF